jgi:dTDP-4-dehydrorhamnose reductase
MRVLLVGCDGQVGTELRRTAPAAAQIVAPGLHELDLTRPEQVRAAVRAANPSLVINAAAYTAVDRAESEPALARALNADAPALLAAEAMRLGAGIIHYSTDYVYDGAQLAPWREDDAPAPLGVYGATKLAGDRAVLESGARAVVLRTSWVYASHGQNFVRTMLRLGREQERLRVVADQHGCPTWARDLARATWTVAGHDLAPGGLFHCAGAGRVSWHGFAQRIFALARARGFALKVREVEPIPASDWPTLARRPANSVLDASRLAREHGFSLPPWEESLAACLDEILAAAEAAPC